MRVLAGMLPWFGIVLILFPVFAQKKKQPRALSAAQLKLLEAKGLVPRTLQNVSKHRAQGVRLSHIRSHHPNRVLYFGSWRKSPPKVAVAALVRRAEAAMSTNPGLAVGLARQAVVGDGFRNAAFIALLARAYRAAGSPAKAAALSKRAACLDRVHLPLARAYDAALTAPRPTHVYPPDDDRPSLDELDAALMAGRGLDPEGAWLRNRRRGKEGGRPVSGNRLKSWKSGYWFASDRSGPLVMDVDGNGDLEVITISRAFTRDGKELAGWVWPADLPYAGSMGDVTGDGLADIAGVSAFRRSVLLCYGGRKGGGYTALWGIDLVHEIQGEPMLVDLDRDGKQEVILLSGGKLYAFDSKGAAMPGWPVTLRAGGPAPPPDRFSSLGNPESSSPAAGDITGSGRTAVALSYGKTVHVLNAKGRPLPGWPKTLKGTKWLGSLKLADLDRNGKLELILAGERRLYVLDAKGMHYRGFPRARLGRRNPIRDPILADIDADGYLEIISNGDPFEINGVQGEPGPRDLSFLADLDGDGWMEQITVAGIYIYRTFTGIRCLPYAASRRLGGIDRARRGLVPQPDKRVRPHDFQGDLRLIQAELAQADYDTDRVAGLLLRKARIQRDMGRLAQSLASSRLALTRYAGNDWYKELVAVQSRLHLLLERQGRPVKQLHADPIARQEAARIRNLIVVIQSRPAPASGQCVTPTNWPLDKLCKLGRKAVPATILALGEGKEPWQLAEALMELGKPKDFDAVRKHLANKSSEVRKSVFWVLFQLDPRRALTEGLRLVSKEPDRRVRLHCLFELLEANKLDATALPVLVRATRDRWFRVRDVAAAAIGRHKLKGGQAALEQLADDVRAIVRLRSKWALGELGLKIPRSTLRRLEIEENAFTLTFGLGQRSDYLNYVGGRSVGLEPFEPGVAELLRCGQVAFPYLVDALQTGAPECRRAAAQALGWLGDGAAIPHLERQLGASSIHFRLQLAVALAKLGKREALLALLREFAEKPPGQDEFQGFASDTNHYKIAPIVAARLGLQEALAPLMRLARQSKGPLAISAALAASQLKPGSGVPLLLKRVRSGKRGGESAAQALEILGYDGLASLLFDEMRRGKHIDFAPMLSRIAPDRYTALMALLIRDPEKTVRESAIQNLWEHGPASSIPLLKSVIRKNSGVESKFAKFALRSLEDRLRQKTQKWTAPRLIQADRATLAELADTLAYQESNDRVKAVEYLSHMRGAKARELLVRALADPDWMVRLQAAGALGRRGGKPVVSAVLAALKAGRFRRWNTSVFPLLQKLTGQDLGWRAFDRIGWPGLRQHWLDYWDMAKDEPLLAPPGGRQWETSGLEQTRKSWRATLAPRDKQRRYYRPNYR